MLIFVISFVLTAIISACFFKNKFWENRYLVLIIGAGVSLVATLVTNYSIRGNLQSKVETVKIIPLNPFYMPDSIIPAHAYVIANYISDTSNTSIDNDTVPYQYGALMDYDWLDDHSKGEFFKDSTKSQIPVTFVLYSDDKDGDDKYWGVFRGNNSRDVYGYGSTYIECSKDSLAYIVKKKLVYDIPPNNWITGFSFPSIKKITVLYFPKRDYDMIPDSLIRKSPF